MTIEPRDRFVATEGMRNNFVTTFQVTTENEVKVIQGDQTEIFPTVTLSPTGYATVTFQTDLSVGEYVTVYRQTGLDSSDLFVEGQPLRAASLNAEHQRISMLLEDMAMHVSDTIHKPKYDANSSLALPSKEQRANKLLGFDADGSVLLTSDSFSILGEIQATLLETENVKDNAIAAQVAAEAAQAAAEVASPPFGTSNILDAAVTSPKIANNAVNFMRLDTDVQELFGKYKNLLINGGFLAWQRGGSGFGWSSHTYNADRWTTIAGGYIGGGGTFERQTFALGQTDVPNNPTYYLRFGNTDIATDTSGIGITEQRAEDLYRFSGRAMSFSIWIKSQHWIQP